jgi:hypothetical protein
MLRALCSIAINLRNFSMIGFSMSSSKQDYREHENYTIVLWYLIQVGHDFKTA